MISLCKVCDPNDWPELETSLNALGAPQEKHKKIGNGR